MLLSLLLVIPLIGIFIIAICIFYDTPSPWGLYFQDTVTPQMEGLVELHNNIMFYLIIILFGVGWIIMSVIKTYIDEKLVSRKYLNHGTLIELIWTIIPALIFILIAFPSFKLLYLMDEVSDSSMSVLAEWDEWYWSYQYSDFSIEDGEFIEFDSCPLLDLCNTLAIVNNLNHLHTTNDLGIEIPVFKNSPLDCTTFAKNSVGGNRAEGSNIPAGGNGAEGSNTPAGGNGAESSNTPVDKDNETYVPVTNGQVESTANDVMNNTGNLKESLDNRHWELIGRVDKAFKNLENHGTANGIPVPEHVSIIRDWYNSEFEGICELGRRTQARLDEYKWEPSSSEAPWSDSESSSESDHNDDFAKKRKFNSDCSSEEKSKRVKTSSASGPSKGDS
jgi:heme/copper-type cytochrome/quinol oxidase subunit 2